MNDTPRMIAGGFDGFMEAIGLGHALVGHSYRHQRSQMKRAFFAGARFYSSFVAEHASDEDKITDSDMALVEALDFEMAAFVNDVLEGRE